MSDRKEMIVPAVLEPPDSTGPPDAPMRRQGRRCGWEGKPDFDHAMALLRPALSRLARDRTPRPRLAGAQISAEAAEVMQAFATRADEASTAYANTMAKIARETAKFDEALRLAGRR